MLKCTWCVFTVPFSRFKLDGRIINSGVVWWTDSGQLGWGGVGSGAEKQQTQNSVSGNGREKFGWPVSINLDIRNLLLGRLWCVEWTTRDSCWKISTQLVSFACEWPVGFTSLESLTCYLKDVLLSDQNNSTNFDCFCAHKCLCHLNLIMHYHKFCTWNCVALNRFCVAENQLNTQTTGQVSWFMRS